MSASYYIEQEAKACKEARKMRGVADFLLRVWADPNGLSTPLAKREAARRELIRRKIWGEAK